MVADASGTDTSRSMASSQIGDQQGELQLSNPSLVSIQRQKLLVRGNTSFGIRATYPTGSLEAVKIRSEKVFPG